MKIIFTYVKRIESNKYWSWHRARRTVFYGMFAKQQSGIDHISSRSKFQHRTALESRPQGEGSTLHLPDNPWQRLLCRQPIKSSTTNITKLGKRRSSYPTLWLGVCSYFSYASSSLYTHSINKTHSIELFAPIRQLGI